MNPNYSEKFPPSVKAVDKYYQDLHHSHESLKRPKEQSISGVNYYYQNPPYGQLKPNEVFQSKTNEESKMMPHNNFQWPKPPQALKKAYYNLLGKNNYPFNARISNVNITQPNNYSTSKGYTVWSKGEIRPNLSCKKNMSIFVEVPDIFKTKKTPNLIPHRRSKRHRTMKRSSSMKFPKGFSDPRKHWPLLGKFEPSRRRLRSELPPSVIVRKAVNVPYWPMLGNSMNIHSEVGDELMDSSYQGDLIGLVDSTRNIQMEIVRKLSELKAKEHMAEDNRRTDLYRAEKAKKDFQEKIGSQMNLLSEAKRADLSAKEAFKRVLNLERDLSEKDKEIHRLKEEEDSLYEELLQSEARVAMVDMEVIPRLPSEEDLAKFMSG